LSDAKTLRITVATKDYDHVRDFQNGVVTASGVEAVWLTLPIEEVFHRFFSHLEFDVSEVSMAKYVSAMARGDSPYVGIPVFPARVFRHSSFWVRADSGFSSPAELAGKRIGVPEWAQTAGVYMRGVLSGEYGVELNGITWYQGGVNMAGRKEHARLALPADIDLTVVTDRSLNDMMLAGELDAVLSARPPAASKRGDGRVRRLFSDPEAVERASRQSTGIMPIMHTIAIRRELVDRHPWLPASLYGAFDAAKARSQSRLRDVDGPTAPLPWIGYETERADAESGGDPWPYGVEANRATLSAFLKWSYEQGVCERLLTPDELFVFNGDGAG